MREVYCHCGERFTVDFPEEMDLEKEPHIFDAILSGSFMSFTCPKCGQELKPEFPVRLVQESLNLDIFYVPELDRRKVLRGTQPYPLPEASRIVIGYQELIEKLVIFEMELDDRVVEILKYYMLKPALESTDSDREIHIYFKERSEDRLIFHIEGIRPDELGVTKLPMESYTKVASEIEQTLLDEPFSDLLSPPYVSINKLYLEE